MTIPAFRSQVQQWFQRSTNRRILAAALTVGGFSVVVKATAMAKELVVAYRFGTGDVIDAFLIAFLLPALVVNVVTGSLNPALTPAYVAVRERRGRAAALELLSSATVCSVILVVAISGLMVAALPVLRILGSGFDAAKLELTRSLYLILLPITLLNALIAIWSAALNSENRFAWAALAPIGVPLLTLVTIVLAPGWGVYAIALGTLFGYAAQCGVLALAMRRADLPLVMRWTGVSPELRGALRQYFPMVAGAALSSGSWAIGQAMAATLPSGSVATLNYGYRIVGVAAEIGSMAIATAVLPHFSLMVARREWQPVRHTVRVYARLIALAVIPLTALCILLSPTIVRLLFERGAFSAADTKLVASVQSLYLLHIPFLMIAMLFVRLASSLHKNQLLLWGAAITLPLNVALNAIFMRWLGVAGIALATSVVQAVTCVFLFFAVGRALRLVETATAQTA